MTHVSVPDWDTYFQNLLPGISARSKDPNTRVGCIITGPNHEIRTTGYNSFPRGIQDDVPERQVRPEKYKWIEHAERNAIYNAARVGIPLDDCTCYLKGMPCMDCSRALVSTGIKRVVVDLIENGKWADNPRWGDDHWRAAQMFREAGVQQCWWLEPHLPQ